jgi:hypothetical protein
MAYLGPCCGSFSQFAMINAAQSSGCIGFRLGLKIRVSVVQFHPWPPSNFLFSQYLQSGFAAGVLVH